MLYKTNCIELVLTWELRVRLMQYIKWLNLLIIMKDLVCKLINKILDLVKILK